MHETSKALQRRLHDSRFASRYFVGDGIDIGGGNDALAQYSEFFPLMRSCRQWDLKDGDAQRLASVPDASLDFAHASHILEHMVDPREALKHWLRVLRPVRRGHPVGAPHSQAESGAARPGCAPQDGVARSIAGHNRLRLL